MDLKILGISFDRDQFVLLISAPLLLTIYFYQGSADFFEAVFPDLPKTNGDLYARYWQFFCFFILLGILPLLYLKLVLKGSLKDYGLSLGDTKFGLKWTLGLTLVIIPLMWIAAGMSDVRDEYPLARILFERRDLFIQFEAIYIIFYYVTWEFFFRGFLLFGLNKSLGPQLAILIQTVSSCLVHLGKPEGEVLGAILVGILFGILALRSGSIWYGWLLHITIGVLTDSFVLIQHGT
ncbi:MAG: CPBP family intramembrane metalloprotease [Saprospiraceae bacterium]|nr:CPBP family intramembrane metalloprotease [Saprospiraceae bacterium]